MELTKLQTEIMEALNRGCYISKVVTPLEFPKFILMNEHGVRIKNLRRNTIEKLQEKGLINISSKDYSQTAYVNKYRIEAVQP